MIADVLHAYSEVNPRVQCDLESMDCSMSAPLQDGSIHCQIPRWWYLLQPPDEVETPPTGVVTPTLRTMHYMTKDYLLYAGGSLTFLSFSPKLSCPDLVASLGGPSCTSFLLRNPLPEVLQLNQNWPQSSKCSCTINFLSFSPPP